MERIKLAIERARQQAGAAAVLSERIAREGVAAAPGDVAPPEAPVQPLQVVPLDAAHLERNRIVTLDDTSPYRRQFDLLRTQVLQRMQEKGWRTLAVTSPSMQSGKTVVAVNLALSIAHHPSRTALLADFDLRRPHVAAALGLPRGHSLNDVLEGNAELRDAIVRAGIPRFLVLPTRHKVSGAAEVLASETIARIISHLRDHQPQRVVILDLPPITAVDDVIAVLPRVDCVLLVVGSGDSTRRELEEAQRHLAHSNVVGVVVNKAPELEDRGDYY